MKTHKKWLTTVVAICSSLFLFAACEPRDDRPAEGPTDQETTYGEPDRSTPPEETMPEDPAQQEQQDTADQWEETPSEP